MSGWGTPVSLPLWQLVLLLVLAAVALFQTLLLPIIRHYYRRHSLKTSHLLDDKLSYGLSPKALGQRRLWIDQLLHDPAVQQAIKDEVKQTRQPIEQVHANAKAYARELVPSFNVILYFRLGYWMARGFLRFLYWVKVGYSAKQQYAEIGKKQCVVVVSNHRSNFDPFFMIYLASKHTAISYSAGEWARGWPFQQLLQAIGFYIIRRDGGSPLYRKMLKQYVQMAVGHCIPQGLFIEGGLSRDGKLQPLKLGMLNYLCAAQGSGECEDIVFVPAALNYDKIPEDRTLLAHQQEGFKRKGRFYSLLSFLKFLGQLTAHILPHKHKPFGYACVNFGEPISLKAWQAERGVDLQSADKNTRIQLINELGQTLADDIESHLPILPVSVISAIFLKNPEQRLSLLDIKLQANEIFESVRASGAYMLLPKSDADYAITQGLYTLTKRKMILRDAYGFYRADPNHRAMFEYYRNSLGKVSLAT